MARKTFNVLFFIKKARLLKNGEAPACMRITVNGFSIHWNIKSGKIPLSDCFLSCPMRRRSLRLLSPGRLHNSDGDTGTFFRVKNYRREFFARKPQARTWKVSSLRVTFSMGLDKGSAAMMDFYRGIWKNAHLAQDNCNHFA